MNDIIRNQAQLVAMLDPIARKYPPMPGGNALDRPQHNAYIERSAFDISLVTGRLGTDITVVDIGGGLGLFSVGMAALGAQSILVDDFAWLRKQTFYDDTFALFQHYGVKVLERDVIANGLELPAKVDAVTNFHFMEHAHHSPKQLFQDVAASLVPGGLFVLAGPNSVNLRKRVTVPLGRGNWSPMELWYEQPVFRGHVREPDPHDLRYIAKDMGLVDVEILGRNFLGVTSPKPLRRRLARLFDRALQHRPGLCSDIYLLASKA